MVFANTRVIKSAKVFNMISSASPLARFAELESENEIFIHWIKFQLGRRPLYYDLPTRVVKS